MAEVRTRYTGRSATAPSGLYNYDRGKCAVRLKINPRDRSPEAIRDAILDGLDEALDHQPEGFYFDFSKIDCDQRRAGVPKSKAHYLIAVFSPFPARRERGE